MKLDRDSGPFAVSGKPPRRRGAALRATLTLLSIVATTACGSAPTPPRVTAPTAPAVGTTRLMAAELTDADEAPRVGKPQHSHADVFDADVIVKDVPHRHAHRRGGGFSGYK